jgi:phosphoribosylanthranilate isomerase
MIVKVCGVRTAEIAAVAVDAGADWIGLVFEARSPRHVDARAADSVRRTVAGRADLIGVMVEPSARECQELTGRHRLDAVQLHGAVSAAMVVDVDVAVIRAINARHRAEALTLQWWPDCLVLLDSAPADAQALPGGTGVRIDLEVAAEVAAHRPIILAGGIDPDNVAEAIRAVRPDGVDASSGLESAPGIKDAGRVRAYVEAARAAFASLSPGAPGGSPA